MAFEKLDDETRQKNMDRALEVRRERAELKTGLKSGTVDPLDVLNRSLDKTDIVAARLKVEQFLRALPNIGTAKASQLMKAFGIDKSRKLQGLGSKQRELMVDFLQNRDN